MTWQARALRLMAWLKGFRYVKFGLVGASGTVVNLAVLYVAHEHLFRSIEPEGSKPYASLALAIAVAGWVNALQLAWYLRRAKVYRKRPGWGKLLRQIALSSLLMVAVIVPLLWLWQDWSAWAWWQRVWRLAALVGSGGAAYALMLWVQGIRPRDLRGH